ncbi:hypothetical protein GGR54DRAFT_644735 [Hypoxylon sp. NC1633]|nr:hypothetical protein GGR54DRAFT_644735 [Hypoxylon sp. NC1633]
MDFKIDEALMLITGRLRATSARELTIKSPLTPIDLRTAALLTAEAIPEGIPFFFAKHHSREQLGKLLDRPEESANSQSILKPVYTSYTTDVQPPPALSHIVRHSVGRLCRVRAELVHENDEVYEPYHSSRLVEVSANIGFTNTVMSLNRIAVVRPKETMPNHFNGVILGQKGAIDSLVTEIVPKNFLPRLSTDFWGEIRITRSYDLIQGEVKEYQ